MRRFIQAKARKAGQAPGVLGPFQDQPATKARIRLFEYDQENLVEKTGVPVEECLEARSKPLTTWIDLEGAGDFEAVSRIGQAYDIHPLTLEDVASPGQRPKSESYDHYILIILDMIFQRPDSEALASEQVGLVLGERHLISFQEGKSGDAFEAVRARLRQKQNQRLRGLGPAYLAHALVDAVVDDYFVVLERLGDKIETLENSLLDQPSRQNLGLIHGLRRDLLLLRRAAWPLREVTASLARTETPLISREVALYFRDTYDHIVEVIETIELFREMLSGYLDTYHTIAGNRLNEVMKVLTLIATIFMPLTFIAGVYGMNFKYMPELEWPWGYFAVLGLMALVARVMLSYFRRKNWL